MISVMACRLLVSCVHRSQQCSDMNLLLLVRCVHSRPAYFAEKLYKSMKGLGTDDSTLIRVIVSRAEVRSPNRSFNCTLCNISFYAP